MMFFIKESVSFISSDPQGICPIHKGALDTFFKLKI